MKDKILHFSISAVLVIVGMLGCYFTKHPKFALAVPAIVFALGIGKELYDKFIKRTKFSVWDFLCDFFGTVIGSIIAGIIVLMIQG